MYICIYVYMCVCSSKPLCVEIYVGKVYMSKCINKYAYTYIYIHMHMYQMELHM